METIEQSGTGGGQVNINLQNVKKAALILRALNHKLRQQILDLIHIEKKITVTEIYVRMPSSA